MLALREGKLVYMAVPKLAAPLPFCRLVVLSAMANER